MAQIDIQMQHALGQGLAQTRAEALASYLSSDLGFHVNTDGDQITVDATSGKHKGANGSIRSSISDIRVELTVPAESHPDTLSTKISAKLAELLGEEDRQVG
jgi:putative polyhydroxyalkanoate system protein